MEHDILEVRLTDEDLIRLCGRYHFGDAGLAPVRNICRLLSGSAIRVSMYSTLLMEEDGKKAVILLTLGVGPDRLKEQLTGEGRLLEAYMAECLCTELLAAAYEEADRLIYIKSGLWCRNYEFPGAQLPLEEIKRLFELLPQGEVWYNKAYAMQPLKSVVYVAGLGETKPAGTCRQKLCEGCNRADCAGNR